MQYRDAWFYWKAKTPDFLIWIGAFISTAVLNISLGLIAINVMIRFRELFLIAGLVVAVGISVVMLLYRTAWPYYTTLVPV